MNPNEKNPEKAHLKYKCLLCDFHTAVKKDMFRHLSTAKHKNRENPNKSELIITQITHINPPILKTYKCKCGNEYKHASSLCNHKKICTYKEPDKQEQEQEQEEHSLVVYKEKEKEKEKSEDVALNNAIIVQILQENKEMMGQIMSLVAKSLTSVTNNNNTMINNNVQIKQFNLNVYLNETCKDAMNIEDFVKTMVITNKDLDDIGYEGFVVVISRVIVREMGKIEEHLRPIHCTDKKRESFYIKTVGEWKKDSDDRVLTISFVKTVANICFRQLLEWKKDKANIKWNDSTDKKHDHYNSIMTQIMNCTIPEAKDLLGIDKVIRNFIPISLITKMKYT